jgi:O-antigen/teichoic acid export membrane protein
MMCLKQQAASGVRWTGTWTTTTTGLRFLQLAILARILAPEDLGLMAKAMILVGFARRFGDTGLRSAGIQRTAYLPKRWDLCCGFTWAHLAVARKASV